MITWGIGGRVRVQAGKTAYTQGCYILVQIAKEGTIPDTSSVGSYCLSISMLSVYSCVYIYIYIYTYMPVNIGVFMCVCIYIYCVYIPLRLWALLGP